MQESKVSANPSSTGTWGFALMLGLILLFCGGKAILFDTLDPDFFWHYRVAGQLERDGIGPIVDEISFASQPEPWTPYSWLAELGMKWVWDHFGLTGTLLTQSLMVAGIFGMIALICAQYPPSPRTRAEGWEREASRLTILVTTAFAALLTLPYLSFRPATAATLILAVIAWLLLRDRRLNEASRALWLIPLLTALCVNLHFFAIFALLWVGALMAGSLIEHSPRWKRYALLLLLSGIGFCCTPMLPGMLGAMLSYGAADPMVQNRQIAEFVPFWKGNFIVAVLVIAAVGAIAVHYRKHRIGDLLWLAGMLILAVQIGRFLSLAAIILAPMLVRSLPKLSDRPLEMPVIRWSMAGVLLLGIWRVASHIPGPSTDVGQWLNRHGPETPGYPVAAANFVRTHLSPQSGRIINEFTWGGYLAFALGDRFQVLMDGRTQVYSPDFWHEFYLNPDRRAALARIDADAAIVPNAKSRFSEALRSMGWTLAHTDDRASVLIPPTRAAQIHLEP